MKFRSFLLAAAGAIATSLHAASEAPAWLDAYNIVWTEPEPKPCIRCPAAAGTSP